MAGPISAGISSGIQFAQRASQLRLQEEQHALKVDQHNAAKLENGKKDLQFMFDTMTRAKKAAPGERKAIINGYNKYRESVNRPLLNEEWVAGVNNPENKRFWDGVLAANMLGQSAENYEMIDNLLTGVSQQDALDATERLGDQKIKISEARFRAESSAIQKAESARLTSIEKEKTRKFQDFGSIKKQVLAVQKELSKSEIGLDRLISLDKIKKQNPKQLSSIINSHIARLSQTISEPGIQSVVRQNELDLLAGNIGIMDKIKLFVSKLKTGQQIDPKEAANLAAIAKNLKDDSAILRKARLAPLVNSTIQGGHTRKAASIFGQDTAAFGKNFKTGELLLGAKPVTQKKTTTKAQPQKSTITPKGKLADLAKWRKMLLNPKFSAANKAIIQKKIQQLEGN